jgi:hypothetical protein
MTFLNTDKMKLSVLVVSFLLLVSAFTFLPAVGAFSPTTVAKDSPAPATVTGATATIDYPVLAGYGQGVNRTISISNPIGNPAITSVTISVPKAAASVAPVGGIPQPTSGVPTSAGATVATYGAGPWAVVYSAGSNQILVPGGATVKITLKFTTETTYASTSGVADTYSLSVAVTDTSGGSTNLSPISVYETASTTVTVTGPSGSLTAGVPFTVQASGTDSGLTLQVTAVGTLSDNTQGVSATTTISPTSYSTGSGTQSISVNDTTAEKLTIYVDGGTLASTSSGGTITGNTGALQIYPGAITALAVQIVNTVNAVKTIYSPTGANKVLNITSGQGLTALVGNGGDANNITVSTADKFGNPVNSTGTTQVTVTADTFSGQSAGFNVSTATYGATYPYTPTHGVLASLQLTIPSGTATVTVPDNYFFGIDYGSQSQIVATSTSGLASGSSVRIVTYTLTSNALTIHAVTLSPKAGSTDGISVTQSAIQQANVPVNFANTTDTVGTFSNGLQSINVTTTVTSAGAEIANATFTPSTLAGATVTLVAKDNVPGTNAVFTYGTPSASITLTTVGGSISKLVVLTALSQFNANAGTPLASTTITTGSMYVAIRTADAYGNPSAVSANTQIQLSTTGGLSASLLEIANSYSDTVNSTLATSWPSGLSESIFTPTTGSSFTITASATVNGVPLTGSTTITVVSATPLLTATGPTTLISGIPSAISGTANASTGIANDKITSITYSVNGATPQAVAFTSAANVAFTFSVLLSGTSNINVTVTDTAGNSAWTIVTVPPLPPAMTFTAPTGASNQPKQYQFPNGGPQAVNATFTNNGASSIQIIVIANVFTSPGGLPETPSPTATATVAAGATVQTFELLNGLPHGTYTVQITVYTTTYVTLSPTYTVTVTV